MPGFADSHMGELIVSARDTWYKFDFYSYMWHKLKLILPAWTVTDIILNNYLCELYN